MPLYNSIPYNSIEKQPRGDIWCYCKCDRAFDLFVGKYKAKYPKAVQCLAKDMEELLAFYDFPAEHRQHIRTTNPIESTFETVRLRTDKTRGCVSRNTMLAMVSKLGQSAQKRWQKLRGYRRLSEVIQGVRFKDGIAENSTSQQEAA